jgi:hypothetical protein
VSWGTVHNAFQLITPVTGDKAMRQDSMSFLMLKAVIIQIYAKI